MVCGRWCGERWCVTKWCVTKWCVKDGVSKMVCDKVVCESAMSATPATQNDGGGEFVPRLPRETKVDVRLCHACHAKCRGVTGAQARPSAPPSAICPTPATQNDSRCEFVPRMSGCATPAPQSAAASRAPNPVQAHHPVPSVPRLPRKTRVDVSLCHACHAKCRGVMGAQARPSAPPSAICPTPATQNDSRCEFVPRLPRETKVDVSLCHACHTNWRGVTGAKSRPKGATQYHKCHACHAKRR